MAETDVSSETRVKVYDFKRPDKFSKDQIRTVAIMHEAFARQSTTGMSSMLRSDCHFHVASVDQLTYEEFIRSIPNPTTIGVLALEPFLKGPALLEIDPGITSAMIDRLFGGLGRSLASNRELTDIEAGLMEGVITRWLPSLRTAWTPVIDLQPRLAAIETKPQFAQIVPPHEMIVLVTLEGKVGEGTGMVNLVLPYITIEPIIPKLSAEYVYSSHRASRGVPYAPAASLPVTVEVCYEGERLSLGALTRLKRGTLVSLPGYASGAAFLYSGGAAVLDLTARPAHGAGKTVYGVSDQRAQRDLSALGAAEPGAPRRGADPVEEAIQSLAASVGAGMKAMETKMAEVLKRQDELSDQVVFQSPDRDASQPGQAEKKRPFGFLSMSWCDALAPFLTHEHPQLVALVLSYLEPGLAACVLERLPQEIRGDITERICGMNRTSPEVLRRVEEILEKKLSAISDPGFAAAGGINAVVEILNVGTRVLEKDVVETLEKTNAALAEEIKKRMFVFEDIVLLDRQTVTRVLEQVDDADLVLSLKAAEEKVANLVWECLAPARVQPLKARLERSGRARLLDVDAAQQRIVAVIRRMEEEGIIIVAREGETVG